MLSKVIHGSAAHFAGVFGNIRWSATGRLRCARAVCPVVVQLREQLVMTATEAVVQY